MTSPSRIALGPDVFPRPYMPRVFVEEYSNIELAAICELWWDGTQWQRANTAPRMRKLARNFEWNSDQLGLELKRRGMPSPAVKGWSRVGR